MHEHKHMNIQIDLWKPQLRHDSHEEEGVRLHANHNTSWINETFGAGRLLKKGTL